MNGKGLRIPLSTYRLQFNAHFRFSDAREIVPYLHRLGISDIYASPYFKARAGSLHGYDILDQNSLNPEIGSEDEYEALVGELKRWDMGQILDIVPNHMCIEGQGNAFWMDVLENGPSSTSASFFDIDWHPVKKELENKILIPILGDQYGTVLENGDLRLSFEEGSFFVYYHDHKLPVIPKTYSNILTLGIEDLERELSNTEPAASGTDEHRNVAQTPAAHHGGESRADRRALPGKRGCQAAPLGTLSKQQQRSGNSLTAMWPPSTEQRATRAVLICWTHSFGSRSIVFPIGTSLPRRSTTAGSSISIPSAPSGWRTRPFSKKRTGWSSPLWQTGKISGLRIDHADGLRDPEEYFRRLQSACFIRMYGDSPEARQPVDNGQENPEAAIREKYERSVADDPTYKPFFIIGEKILLKAEKVPESWPVFGTTGYDFAIQVNGLFVDTANAKLFETLYTRFLQQPVDFQDVVYEKKKLVMQVAMSSEINTLGHYLNRISEQNRHTRDFTLNSLIKSIVEVIANFPVYRTYINSFEVSERDRQYIESAVGRAKRQNPAISASVFDFIRDVLLLRFPDTMDEEHKPAWLDFVKRFQQITGPVMAKGVEDTAFYLYNRLVSLNEVGGSPERFGISLETFHGQNIERCKSRPLAMLATSTHDTKRSEDVRARINVLSEIPEHWREGLSRWSRQNRKFKTDCRRQARTEPQ